MHRTLTAGPSLSFSEFVTGRGAPLDPPTEKIINRPVAESRRIKKKPWNPRENPHPASRAFPQGFAALTLRSAPQYKQSSNVTYVHLRKTVFHTNAVHDDSYFVPAQLFGRSHAAGRRILLRFPFGSTSLLADYFVACLTFVFVRWRMGRVKVNLTVIAPTRIQLRKLHGGQNLPQEPSGRQNSV